MKRYARSPTIVERGSADDEVAQQQVVEDRSTSRSGADVLDRAVPEDPADHGGAMEECLLVGRQVVDARGDQRLQRVRDALGEVVAAALEQHPDRLLDEERVALGLRRAGPRALRAEGRLAAAAPRGALRSLPRASGSSSIAAARMPPSAPTRAKVEQLGAGQADDQQRRLAHPGGEMLDQLEQRLLGPVDVLEDQDKRLHLGEHDRPTRAPPRRSPGRCAPPRPRRARPRRGRAGRRRPRPRRSSRSFSTASWTGSSSAIPADDFTISASGQYVIPSPYGSARPARTVAPSSAATNSRTRRLLPTPGSP